MATRHGPVFEVTFFVAEDVADEHQSWIEEHALAALQVAGVVDCQLFLIADDESGRKGRVCQFSLDSAEALDKLVDGFGAALIADAIERYPDQIDVHSRVLLEDASREPQHGEHDSCLNCGASLRGQYCGHCGQRARSRLISLWELVSDAFGDLFELDSRLWQTLVPLMIRPGKLTHDYLQGRRARYMPPFRMYLVLSLLFFLVAFFDPQEKLSVLFEPEADAPTSAESTQKARDVREEVLKELAAEGIIASGGTGQVENPEDGTTLDFQFGADDECKPGEGEESDCVPLDEAAEENCGIDDGDLEDLPAWLARRLTKERLTRICEQTQIDNGRTLINRMLDNIPTALIVLLPIMALVLKGLYPLSRRYYVEHLLFFVHFHAFFFLILSLEILLSRVTEWLRVPETIPVLLLVVASFYIPAYLFMAMRKVYGQGRAVTFLKYVVLSAAYATGFGLTMFAAFAIAAFSI